MPKRSRANCLMHAPRGRGLHISALALGIWVLISGCAAPRPIEQAHTAMALPTETLPMGYTPLPFQLARPTDQNPTPTAPIAPTAPAPTPASVDQRSQYERWIAEARVAHPYPETAEAMLQVMMCESSGDAAMVAGPYHGLFQYLPSTWAGDWNPYRDQPILDARAQIFATARAWQEGYQSWWGCYQAPS